MYNNKEGNKILLEILRLPFEIQLKDKITSVVMYEQSSKYNSRSWVGLIGKCKTGKVGTSYSSFGEAHHVMKKKYYN